MFQVFLSVYFNVCNGYTRGFQVFSGVLLVIQTYVASVLTISDVCYKCFIWML
jgi:hypothetical protein